MNRLVSRTLSAFRFTIRDVLWLTVVVAVCLAWWADHRQHARMQLKFTVVERMLQVMVNQYYAETGRHVVVSEDVLNLHFRPTNSKDIATP